MTDPAPPRSDADHPIVVEGLRNAFGSHVIHEDLSLTVNRGEIIGVVGGSGTGKSVLMRSIIGLQIPEAGRITVLGRDITAAEVDDDIDIRARWGVLFQGGALFSTLTVAENIEVPLKEFYPEIAQELLDEIARFKVMLSGLPESAAVGRDEEARRTGPQPRARSRTAVPRRADRRARPDRCGRVRPADPRAQGDAGADRVPDHA